MCVCVCVCECVLAAFLTSPSPLPGQVRRPRRRPNPWWWGFSTLLWCVCCATGVFRFIPSPFWLRVAVVSLDLLQSPSFPPGQLPGLVFFLFFYYCEIKATLLTNTACPVVFSDLCIPTFSNTRNQNYFLGRNTPGGVVGPS